MAGNEELISAIIDPSASKQVNDLKANMAALQQQFVDTAKAAIELNKVTGGSTSNSSFQKAAEASSKATKQMVDDQNKIRHAEQQVAAERDARMQKEVKQRQQQQAAQDKANTKEEASLAKLRAQQKKAADDYEKEQARMAAAKSKATQKEIDDDQKQLAIMARIARQREKDASAFKKLLFDRDQARDKAQNIGATFGSDSDLFGAAQKEFEGFQKQVDGINNKLGKFTDNVGNYAGKAFGLIRNIAYILPGIGIAGIFGLLSDGIIKFYQALASGETIRTTMNNLERKASDIYAGQITTVKLLTEEAKSQNTTSLRRQEIIEQLNKISPTYFGNLKDEQDIVSKLPGDYKAYNAAILENSRAKAAAEIIGDKYKEILQLQRDIIEGQDNANPDRAGGFAALQELSFAIDQLSEPGKQHSIKMLQEQITRLTKEYVSSSQKAGDVTGEQLQIEQRMTNEATEYNKMYLQNRININDDIASNDKKSYGARYRALKDSLADQIQVLQYSALQELNTIGLTKDQEKAILDKNNFDILKARQDYIKKKRDIDESASGQDLEHLKNTLQAQKDAAKLIIDNPGATVDQKLIASDTSNKASTGIINATYKAELRMAGENYKSIKLASDNKNKALKEQAIQYQADQEKILKEGYDNQIANAKKHDTDLFNELISASEIRVQTITNNARKEIDALDKQYEKGGLDSRIYEAKRLSIIQKSEDDILNEKLKAAKYNILLLTLSGLDASAEQKRLSDLEIQQFKTTEQRKTEYLKQEQALRDQLVQSETNLRVQAEQAVLDTIQKLVVAGYENQIAKSKEQSDAISENADTQKAAVERSLASAEDKAAKEKTIDAQAADAKKVLAGNEAKLKSDEAKANKEVSLINIGVATAEAVGKIELQAAILAANPLTIGLVGLALAQIPIAIAAGAIQAAAILATPLPKFEKGGITKGGGLIWGEKGAELAIEPSGKSYLSPDHATYTTMPAGTKIIPHNQLTKPMRMNNAAGGEQVPWKDVIAAIERNKPRESKRPVVNGWMRESMAANDWGYYAQRLKK